MNQRRLTLKMIISALMLIESKKLVNLGLEE
jgi:hypothetical protein